MNGKGSARRPSAVDAATFDANWRRVFAQAVEETKQPTAAAVHGELDSTT